MTNQDLRIGVVGVAGGQTSEALADELEKRTGHRLLIEMERIHLDTTTGHVFCGDVDLCSLDGLVVKKIGKEYSPHLLDRLEILIYVGELGVPIISNPVSILRLIDRLSCTLTLKRGNIPIPPTVITEDLARAADAIQSFGRAVLKPLYSTKARGMRLIDAGDPKRTLREVMEFKEEGNQVLYIQKKIEVPDRDLGIVFLNGNHVGTYARIRGGDSWNTTIHAGGRYGSHETSAEVIELARRAQSLFGLDFSSVDVAETPDGPVVFEVSAFGGFRGLWEGPGINAAELLADYVAKKLGDG